MSNNESSKYFDLHTTGIGYLNHVREVTPKEGNPFLSVTIAALSITPSTPTSSVGCPASRPIR